MGPSEFKVRQVHNKKLACTGLSIQFVTTIRSLSIHSMNVIFICVSGLGVLLVVVVGVGWKCTPRGHEPLHALFNLGDFRRRSRRPRERRRRDGRWYGGKDGKLISNYHVADTFIYFLLEYSSQWRKFQKMVFHIWHGRIYLQVRN